MRHDVDHSVCIIPHFPWQTFWHKSPNRPSRESSNGLIFKRHDAAFRDSSAWYGGFLSFFLSSLFLLLFFIFIFFLWGGDRDAPYCKHRKSKHSLQGLTCPEIEYRTELCTLLFFCCWDCSYRREVFLFVTTEPPVTTKRYWQKRLFTDCVLSSDAYYSSINHFGTNRATSFCGKLA